MYIYIPLLHVVSIDNIEEEWMGLDIGPKTLALPPNHLNPL
jgi:3-phosphoglycerate kinase